MEIFAAKQVGDLSYMCSGVPTIIKILEDGHILAARSPEINPKTGKKENYVSFSRNKTSANSRNPDRWNSGLLFDGDKMSEHTHIEPFSFAGTNLKDTSRYRLKTLTAYEDGTYRLSCVNWSTIQISERMYNDLVRLIESMPEEDKQKKKFIHTIGGKRKVNGTMIKEKWYFNTKNGGPVINLKTVSPSTAAEFQNNTMIAEEEERVWLGSKDKFVFVGRGILLGVILSKEDAKKLQDPEYALEDEDFANLDTLLVKHCGQNYEIVTY